MRDGRLPRLLVGFALALMVGGCGPAASASASPAEQPPLVTIETHGGMCPNGECRSLTVIERDGRIRRVEPSPAWVAAADPASIARLATAIDAADFAALRADAFTAECPTAYDGQELVYTFFVGGVTEPISSCSVRIDRDAPLFVAVAAVLAQTPAR